MLMKNCKKWGALLPLLAVVLSCDDFGLFSGPAASGELRWVLDRASLTKASEEIPDTNDFILSVRSSGGSVLYEGPYGDSPQTLPVDEGYYSVAIRSVDFPAPAFSCPQYGDEQVVRVQAGESVTVRLQCTLLNAGIRLKTGSDFLTAFPNGILFVKQDDTRLKYLYRETRIAYVKPGDVSVLLYQDGKDETLFTRTVPAREILTVTLSAPQPGTSGRSSISVQTDTTKLWEVEHFIIGGDSGGQEPQSSIPVGEAAQHVGETNIWVCGYIVGGDLSSTGKTVKTTGIQKSTHLAMADRSSVTDKASCLAVELPSGKVREALNLVDHPELIGRRICVKGKLVDKYFGTTGMKSTSDWQLK